MCGGGGRVGTGHGCSGATFFLQWRNLAWALPTTLHSSRSEQGRTQRQLQRCSCAYKQGRKGPDPPEGGSVLVGSGGDRRRRRQCAEGAWPQNQDPSSPPSFVSPQYCQWLGHRTCTRHLTAALCCCAAGALPHRCCPCPTALPGCAAARVGHVFSQHGKVCPAARGPTGARRDGRCAGVGHLLE